MPTREPIGEPTRPIRTHIQVVKALNWFLLIGIAAVATASALWQSMQRPPFVLAMSTAPGGAVVQITQLANNGRGAMVSPQVTVSIPLSAPVQVALTSGDVKIPGGVIEFNDVTLLPGRFKIRFGDTLVDVMSAVIIIDEVEHAWMPQQ